MKIAIVTSIHPAFDKRVWRHAYSLSKKDIQIYLICPWDDVDDPNIENIEFIPFKRVDKRWKRPFLVPVRVYRKLFKIIDQVDIIHFHDLDLLPFMAPLVRKKTIVYDVHENYPEEMLCRDWIPRLLRRPLFYFVKAFENILSKIIHNAVLVSDAQRPRFETNSINIHMMYNYASLDLLDSVSDDYEHRKNNIIFIGTHYENNGSLLLLKIAELTSKQLNNVQFIVTDTFSNQKFKQRFFQELKNRNLENVIKIVPKVKPQEIMGLINTAKVAINPVLNVDKQRKAINTKLFEFMAGGVPFVTTKLPYTDTLVKHTNSGMLADDEDSMTFVQAIIKLINDNDLAKTMGNNGQRFFADEYSWEAQVDPLIEFYYKMLRKK